MRDPAIKSPGVMVDQVSAVHILLISFFIFMKKTNWFDNISHKITLLFRLWLESPIFCLFFFSEAVLSLCDMAGKDLYL